MEFKDIVKKLRLELGLQQGDIAKALDVAPAFISQIESGKKKISIENLIKLADIFNVSIDELIGRSNPKPSTYVTNFLTKEENEMLLDYRELCEDDKIKCQNIIKALKATPPAKKNINTRCV